MDDLPRVHIVDDNAAYRDSLAALVTSLGFSQECYESGRDYLARGSALSGCVILDLRMPDGDGAAVIEHLSGLKICQPVIVLTGNANVPDIVNSYRSGRIVSFLEKQTLNDISLLEAIQHALQQDVERRAQHKRLEELKLKFQSLTDGEKEVLDRLLAGRESVQIAKELQISRRTVETRRGKIMEKLDVDTLAALIQVVVDLGYWPRP